jgi:hypothetical protein
MEAEGVAPCGRGRADGEDADFLCPDDEVSGTDWEGSELCGLRGVRGVGAVSDDWGERGVSGV